MAWKKTHSGPDRNKSIHFKEFSKKTAQSLRRDFAPIFFCFKVRAPARIGASAVTARRKSEKAGDYIYTISVNVTGSAIEYAAAMKELMNSEIGKKCPGMMKLMSGRAGTESSHLGVLSAPSFAALNEYLDSYTGNKDWDNFLSKAVKISTPTGTGFLRVVKIWK